MKTALRFFTTKFFLAIFLSGGLVGCSNDIRPLLHPNEVSGYTLVLENCSDKNCVLRTNGKFWFLVDSPSQKVSYKLQIEGDKGLNKLFYGQLGNCTVVSSVNFSCDGLASDEGNLRFVTSYDSESVQRLRDVLAGKPDPAASGLVSKKPGDFQQVDALSDSWLVKVASYFGLVRPNSKEHWENYDLAAYVAIVVVAFSALNG